MADLTRFRALALAVVAAFALVACTATTTDPPGGPTDPTTEPTNGTPEPGNGCEAPPLGAPPPGSQVLDEDCVSVTVDAGDVLWFHGDQVLEQQNIAVPACAGFGSIFSWYVTSSDQPAVSLFIAPQGVPQPGVSGSAGALDGYCGTVAIEHDEAGPVTLDLRYQFVDLCPGC